MSLALESAGHSHCPVQVVLLEPRPFRKES